MTDVATQSASSRLDSLKDVLLVQCRSTDLPVVTDSIAGDRRCGIVLTASNLGAARQRLRHLTQQVPAARILLETGASSGKNRKWASEPFNAECIDLQRALGMWVLPDAGYIGPNDTDGLLSVLRRSRQLGADAIAPLAVHPDWFAGQAAQDRLINGVVEADVPIAVMLEHPKDPLSAARTLRGVLRLIRESPRPVIFLRCDLSSIGLLCHGAHAAAVGTTTSLRHIYPLPTREGGGGRPATVSAIVRECLSYVSLEKIFMAVQADPDNQMWVCGCSSCNGETIDQLQMRADRETAAFVHSFEVVRELWADLLINRQPATRASSWAAQCDNALFRADEMTAIDTTWPSPKMLAHWAAVQPATRHR